MSTSVHFSVTALLRPLENGLLLGEVLFFPEIIRLSASRPELLEGLRESVRQRLPLLPPRTLGTRRSPGTTEVGHVEVQVPPPPRDPAWREAIRLGLDVLHFAPAGPSGAVAYVPALGIEVLGTTREQVDARLEDEILAELMRRRATLSLPALAWLQRSTGLEVERLELEVALPAPHAPSRSPARVDAALRPRPAAPVDLQAVRWALEARVLGQEEAVNRVVEALGATRSTPARAATPLVSLLLVGPPGSGKSELAATLAGAIAGDRTRLARFDLGDHATPRAVHRLLGPPGQGGGRLVDALRGTAATVMLFDRVEKAPAFLLDLLVTTIRDEIEAGPSGRTGPAGTVVLFACQVPPAPVARPLLGFVPQADRDASRRESARPQQIAASRRHVSAHLLEFVDDIVTFEPLDADTLQRIAERELENLQQREGLLSREVSLEVDDGVAAHLAERCVGSPRGAHGLRQALQRGVLAPLAAGLNRHAEDVPLRARVGRRGFDLDVEVAPRAESVAPPRRHDPALLAMVRRLSELRRETSSLAEACARPEGTDTFVLPAPGPEGGSLPSARRGRASDIEALADDVARAEDQALLTVHGGGMVDPRTLASTHEALSRRLADLSRGADAP